MADKKTNRESLKSHFKNGMIPNEDHFAQLIDSSLNLAEDGLTIKGGRVGIGTEDPKARLHVYGSLLLDARPLIGDREPWFMKGETRYVPFNSAGDDVGLAGETAILHPGVSSNYHLMVTGVDIERIDIDEGSPNHSISFFAEKREGVWRIIVKYPLQDKDDDAFVETHAKAHWVAIHDRLF